MEEVVNRKSVFSLVSEMESVGIELDLLRDLMNLYDEFTGDEVGRLNPEEPWKTQCFVNRWDMSRALLRSIEEKIANISEMVKAVTKDGYDLLKVNRAPE